jgi:hypothetical protein
VISWIGCYAPRKAVPEITRNNTNNIPRQIRVSDKVSLVDGINSDNNYLIVVKSVETASVPVLKAKYNAGR